MAALKMNIKYKELIPITPKRKYKYVLLVALITAFAAFYYIFVYCALPPLVAKAPPLRSWSKPEKANRLVVSLSTFPSRLSALVDSMDSFVLDQTRQPDKVYVWVPLDVERLGLHFTSSMQERTKQAVELILNRYGGTVDHRLYKNANFSDGPVSILSTVDYGPMTKLIPTLLEETDPNTLIVTADDDVLFYDFVFEELEQNINKHKNFVNTYTCESAPHLYSDRQFMTWSGKCAGWVNGCAGTIYRRKFFQPASDQPEANFAVDVSEATALEQNVVDSGVYPIGSQLTKKQRITIYSDKVFHVKAPGVPEGCRLHDDVWLSGVLYRRGIPAYVIERPDQHGSVIRHTNMNRFSINGAVHRSFHGERDQWDCVTYFDQFK